MEFTGKVAKLLPLRSGTSARTGNEWKALPFVFEYFEHPTDRYADSVVLETFDTKVMDTLKEGMEVRCGFSHRTREYEGRYYNELRLYKIEGVPTEQPSANMQEAAAAQGTTPQTNVAAPLTDNTEKTDDLPF
jgi:hypothetical protein